MGEQKKGLSREEFEEALRPHLEMMRAEHQASQDESRLAMWFVGGILLIAAIGAALVIFGG